MTPKGNLPEVVSPEAWLKARRELLAREKELTRLRDQVNAERRRLPMVRIAKDYRFEGPNGALSLLDMFEGRTQLVIHHFMFAPEWDEGCPSCASAADGLGKLRQLHARNTTLAAVSRAPYPKLAAFSERMGWTFPWYSSYGTDFNYDFYATVDDQRRRPMVHFRTREELAEAGFPLAEDLNGEWPGISAFLQVDGTVFHTYSTYGRGIEEFHYNIPHLDLTALGRQEEWEEPKGRAEPLGMQVGRPGMRLLDDMD
jgi:predicted dithiol-disulfide oxidoreductase (DUF899 family)